MINCMGGGRKMKMNKGVPIKTARPEGEREELREGKDRMRRASKKSLGKAQKDFADAGENPAVPGEAQPGD